MLKKTLCSALLLALAGCAGGTGRDAVPIAADETAPPVTWALAIHGGAGTPDRSMPEEQVGEYRAGLQRALDVGAEILARGGSSLDAVEQVIRTLEDDPHFNAGRGAVYNHEGGHELDASIMSGADLACGAVARVTTVRHPISLARGVMEHTRHVLLSGDGAERFADELGVERVDPSYFDTDDRFEQLQRALARERGEGGGTVGAVALDREGNLAAGTSTGGLTDKMFGRIGDSPIVGAGTYARNGAAAVSGTGRGEEFIRHGVALSIAAMVEREGLPLAQAVHRVVHEVLAPGDGGVIALDSAGRIVMDFNTEGMYRGSVDSSGETRVSIWE